MSRFRQTSTKEIISAVSNVTKIVLELEEAPDDRILVGSVSSDMGAAAEINSTYPDGIPGPGTVVVRAEEALIVILVLVLWVAAIALFFNRWGKIRMLEPYQPKFQQQHRQSCAMIEQNPLQHRTYSKFNIHCLEHPVHQTSCAPGDLSRPRQNSVFVGSSASLLPMGQETARRTKSAFDIQSLVLAECTVQTGPEERDEDTLNTLRPLGEAAKVAPGQRDRRTSFCQFDRMDVLARPLQRERGSSVCQFDRMDVLARPLQRERGSSVCQFDRMDVLARPFQRERGSSICQFDRMDVLARPLQRDRGMSICQFDRTDVLARPLQRDRGMSICHFDRMDAPTRPLLRDRGSSVLHFDRTDVFARPVSTGRSLSRERRVSVCNLLEREDGRAAHRDRRSSVSNVDKIEAIGKSAQTSADRQETVGKGQKEKSSVVHHFDRPSCSKTPDPVYGYKATCV